MIQTAVLAGLALRELWFSYRLLATLFVLLLAGAPAAVLPHAATASLAGAPPSALTWYAVALGGSLAIVSALTAGAMAGGRRHGWLGWLALRPVPRPRLAIGWFLAWASVLLVGLVFAALLAWVALSGSSLLLAGPAGFAAAMGAVAALGLLVIGLGLLIGSVLAPIPASLLALLLAGGLGLVGFGGWLPADLPLPSGILPLLAELDIATRPLATALPLTGVALAIAAGLLLAAAAALQRADL